MDRDRGSVEDGMATLQLIGSETPFESLAKPGPDMLLPREERDIGGLKIIMVKTMMDELEYVYQDGCNRLTMRKKH